MPATTIDRASTMLRASGIFALGVAALLAAATVLVVGWSLRDGRAAAIEEPTFSTTASGTVEVPPSSATTRVGLRACDAGPGGALQVLNNRFAGMSRAWRDAGVPKDDISRGGVSTTRQAASRWCSTLDAVVTVEDLDLVDEVLGGIARHPRGIQHVSGPVFDYDAALLEEGALDEAMRVARRKAEDAAARAGTEVVGVDSLVEGPVSVARPEDEGIPQYRYPIAATSGTAMSAEVSADMDTLAKAVGTASGQASATVSVDAVFRLAG